VLPENYYLSNFEALTSFVKRTYHELLSADELAWCETVQALPEQARRLYIRLLSRRGNTFRLGKFNYPEIANLAEAAQLLAQAQLAHTQPPEELGVLLQLVTRQELMKLPEAQPLKGLSRAQLDDHLLALESPEVHQQLASLDQWVTIEGSDIFELYVMCYFGNRYQDLTEFVVRDLGHLTYETYTIDDNTRAFQTREQIDAHWRYFQCQALLEQIDVTDSDALTQLNALVPSVYDDALLKHDVHLVRRVGRFRNQVARQLERLQLPARALAVYQQTHLPPSRERQVRLLLMLEQDADALSLVTDMSAAPLDDSEARFAERQVPLIKKRLGQRVGKTKPFKPTTTKLTLQTTADNTNHRVEWRALQYYQQSGRCYYSENSLVRSVLGLFIWDLMFAPVDGAFHHPFQAGPSDLMEPEFTTRRQSLFEERWKELDDPLRFAARVWQHFEEKQGLSNVLVHWQALSEDLLSDALIRIPTAHWRAMFNRLLADLRHNGKGLPDLVLFPSEEGYEFIEIKGPGDALQQHQRRWMQYFTRHHIPHRVVNVRYTQLERDA
jgi:hypothetical protein